MINNTIRVSAYKAANVVQTYLYGSNFSCISLQSIAKKWSLYGEKFETFIITIGDIILGFYKIEDTVPLLQQELGLDAKTAALLGADVLDFLAPLSDPNFEPPEEEDDYVNTESSPTIVEPNSTYHQLITPNDQIDHLPTEIPELRTMAADMTESRSPVRSAYNAGAEIDEPVYTSTQPSITKSVPAAPSYTAPMYEQPKPNVDAPIEKPRWG